jgi:mannose-1-phosphate guanylyltransferase
LKAILLAAGFGTRLKPITDHTPKCLVLIHGKPLLQILVENLFAAGIKSFLINTHYLNEKVENFIHLNLSKYDIKIAYEPELLGTAGTLRRNNDFFKGDDTMLVHADNYFTADLKPFLGAHRTRPMGCLMTMLTFRTNQPTSCGIVELNKSRVVIGFHEKVSNPPGNLANGAVYILSSELLKMIVYEMPYVNDFSTEVLCNLIGKIYTWETPSKFIDIGTLESYNDANNI